MPNVFKPLPGTANQSITITIDGLTNNGQRQGVAIDNTTALLEDALVRVKIVAPASGTLATGVVNVYAYGTVNGGTDYCDSASGADAAITLTVPPNMNLIGVINVVANGVTYPSKKFSVAKAFDGIMPDHWGIVIENKTGGTLGTGCTAIYQGFNGQIVSS